MNPVINSFLFLIVTAGVFTGAERRPSLPPTGQIGGAVRGVFCVVATFASAVRGFRTDSTGPGPVRVKCYESGRLKIQILISAAVRPGGPAGSPRPSADTSVTGYYFTPLRNVYE